jgi:steroid 5-alpha reductase family enzyme
VSSILVSFAISLAVNAAFFAVAASRKTDVVTDLSYSLSFAALAIGLPLLDGAHTTAQLLASGFVLVWAVRLGAYLFGRILRVKVDHRFDGMRERPLRFARFWILQAITVAIVMLPVSYLLNRKHAPALGAWAIAGGADRPPRRPATASSRADSGAGRATPTTSASCSCGGGSSSSRFRSCTGSRS